MSDLIDRQAVLDIFDVIKEEYPQIYTAIEVSIRMLPSVTPTERTGHWIEKEDFNGDTYYDCSECGESFCLMDGTPTDNLYNFCPNCGADMRGTKND